LGVRLVLCLLLRLREEMRVGRAGCVGLLRQLAAGMLPRSGGVHVLLLRRHRVLLLWVSACNPAHHA